MKSITKNKKSDRITIIKRYKVENVNNRQKTWKLVLLFVLLPQNINMDFLEYKGYKGSVEYSKEDNCLFGKVQGMSKALILYEGNTLEELRKDFEDGVDSYIEACKTDGVKPAKP